MPRIPFPRGLEGIENLPRTNRNLQNCFNNGSDKIIGRPGIQTIGGSTGAVVRTQFKWNDDLYEVRSQNLVKITNTETGATSTIGTIAGSAVVEVAIGFNDAVLVVRGGNLYTLSNSTKTVTIESVGSGVGGIANFNYTITNTVPLIVIPTTVTISGFTVNTSYNVENTSVTSSVDEISSTTIDSVADSVANPGTASFVHAGTSPILGSEVTISGYVTNTTYNTTGIVTATTVTTFEVSTIAFGTDESGGSYTALASFQISSISFGTDEAGSYVIVLTDISANANILPSVDVAHINGRFVYIPADGSPAFFSDVGAAGTVQVDSFFDAEELPDKNNAVFASNKNTLFIGGEDSWQPFANSDTKPFFIRIGRSRISNGFIGGLLEYNEVFLFIGNEKDQSPGIYSIAEEGAKKISNQRIDLILSTYTLTELSEVNIGRVKWRGYDFATFKLSRDSFGYFNGNWPTLDTVIDDISRPWSADFITEFEGEYFVASDDKFGKFAKINTDFGNRITRIIDLGFEQEDGEFFSFQSLELGISQGFNTADGSVALFMSDDNVQYGPPLFINLGDLGQYQRKLIWDPPGGIGGYDGFMGARIYTTEDIDFNCEYIIAI